MGSNLSYLITVSQAHLVPAMFLVRSLRQVTSAQIVAVGNLTAVQARQFKPYDVKYIDEDDIDYSGRLPKVTWEAKHRKFGWYKQMFIRLSIDRFMDTDQVVILDSEVFVFENWDESKFYDPATGKPRAFYWVPKKRKPEWDYMMYRGAAYLLSFLPGTEGIMDFAGSDKFRRHISGVVLFSTKNVRQLWRQLEQQTDLQKNIDDLFNNQDKMTFSDHDIYGLAVDYGLFDSTVPTVPYNDLLGWYDSHDDPVFNTFKKHAMWSMCQNYAKYGDADSYNNFMQKTAAALGKKLPVKKYWNKADEGLIDYKFDSLTTVDYLKKYKKQLNFTFRRRYETFYGALSKLQELTDDPVIVEIGTLRDNSKGGGHSTYKFAEFCSRFGGIVHTVDISKEAIKFSKAATADFKKQIRYHLMDSEQFFKGFKGKIDFLYLDGWDSTPGHEKDASDKQLKEIRLALPLLSDKCLVLLDDADLPEGGKTRFSSVYLKKHGFALIQSGYQQLYMRRSRSLKHRLKAKIGL